MRDCAGLFRSPFTLIRVNRVIVVAFDSISELTTSRPVIYTSYLSSAILTTQELQAFHA
jgi:hypothetical protein